VIAEDAAVQKWVEEKCAKCTKCGVYIEHGGMCDQIFCYCGETFSFRTQRLGFGEDGYDEDGFDRGGFDEDGDFRDEFGNYGIYDEDGFDRSGFDEDGDFRDGGIYDDDGFDRDGYDGYGFGRDGFNEGGFDRNERFRDGGMTDDAGYDADGYDDDGRHRDRCDHHGYCNQGRDGQGLCDSCEHDARDAADIADGYCLCDGWLSRGGGAAEHRQRGWVKCAREHRDHNE